MAISRSAREEPWPTAEHRRLGLLDADAVRALVGAVWPDAIIHQGTSLTGLGNNIRRLDDTFATTNRLRTEGTATLIAAADRLGTTPRLIAQSFCGWP